MKKVLVFGTFDGFHKGHINFLKQAKKYGDYLIAVIARDATVKRIKHCLPVRIEAKRAKEVLKSKLVDNVLLGDKSNPYKIIGRIKPDVICLGYDQSAFVGGLPKALKKMGLKTRIYRAKPYYPRKFHSRILNKRKCADRKES